MNLSVSSVGDSVCAPCARCCNEKEKNTYAWTIDDAHRTSLAAIAVYGLHWPTLTTIESIKMLRMKPTQRRKPYHSLSIVSRLPFYCVEIDAFIYVLQFRINYALIAVEMSRQSDSLMLRARTAERMKTFKFCSHKQYPPFLPIIILVPHSTIQQFRFELFSLQMHFIKRWLNARRQTCHFLHKTIRIVDVPSVFLFQSQQRAEISARRTIIGMRRHFFALIMMCANPMNAMIIDGNASQICSPTINL